MSAWPASPCADPRLAAIADLIARWPGGELPEVAALHAGLRDLLEPAGLGLRTSAPAPRRKKGATDPRSSYELRIAETGEIPTRPNNLHDAFNALAWAAFPAAKRALTGRIAALQRQRLDADGRLPSARSREHDRLALLDEGGLIVLDDGGVRLGVVVGHAIWEHAALGQRAVRAATVALPVAAPWRWRVAAAPQVRAAVDAAWLQLVTTTAQLHAAMDAHAGLPIDDASLWSAGAQREPSARSILTLSST